ncbi:hypothetical protein KC345_g3625 [Hortaea werneckii]|nr:hypothetical protein KC345_g3625 [Hortaea werneckii]
MASSPGHASASASASTSNTATLTPDSAAKIEHIRTRDRLSTPFPFRLPLAMALSSCAGFALGTYHGSSESGLRFRAENAHRFPTTQTGWYLYHKSKNYHMALGGIKEGLKMGARQAGWVGVFVGMEECIDRGRAGVVRMYREVRGMAAEERIVAGNRDFVSTVLAGIGTAGLFSVWHQFPVPTAARVAKMGARIGLVYGVLQDCVGALRGRRLGYVEFIKRHTIGTKEDEPMETVADAAG